MFISLTLVGCSAVADFAMSKLLPGTGGGVSAELTVGDKEQTLGNNIDVKADKVDKIVGNSDNSTGITSAGTVTVTNNNYPTWLIVLLLIGNVITLCLPTPTQMWVYFRTRI